MIEYNPLNSVGVPTYITFAGGAFTVPTTMMISDIAGSDREIAALPDAVLDREYRFGRMTYVHDRLRYGPVEVV